MVSKIRRKRRQSSNCSFSLSCPNKDLKSKIVDFKKKKINVIKSKINNKKFDLSLILKKLYNLGCRNILVEGGNELTKNFLSKKIFNQFYLFQSPKKLSKLTDYKEFNGFNILNNRYKKKYKISPKLAKDNITIYKR